MPFREAFVSLRRLSDGVQVGSANAGVSGSFTLSWSDASNAAFPETYQLVVLYKNSADFYITNADGAQLGATGNVTLADGSESLGASVHVGSAEVVQVYATAEEVWLALVSPASSALLSNRMIDVRLSTSTSDESSHMVDKNHVRIRDGRAVNAVSTVAHELGHSANAHAWDETWILYNPWCIPSSGHVYNGALPCEKAAWVEGFADFFATAFAWTNNAPAATFPGFEVEMFNDNCDVISNPWDVEGCHAAALWDIWDDPTGDDDVLDGTPDVVWSQIMLTLDEYQNGCLWPANRCSNEGGDHGTNHWDFLENFEDEIGLALRDEVESVYAITGLDRGGDGPYP